MTTFNLDYPTPSFDLNCFCDIPLLSESVFVDEDGEAYEICQKCGKRVWR